MFNRFGIKSILLVLIIILFINPISSNNDSNPTSSNLDDLSTLNEDIFFSYNNSYSRQEFIVELSSLNLDAFNCINLIFETSGYRSDGSLKVSFIFDNTEVVIFIDGLYQNQIQHNLTEAFTFPNLFNGPMNITIVCEGRTSFSYYTGTLHIFSSTNIKVVNVPILADDPTIIPTIPNWITKQGYLGTTSSEIRSAFYNLNSFPKLNLTFAFFSNDFTASTQKVEIKLDNQVIHTIVYDEGEPIEEQAIIPIEDGLNILSLNFVVEYCIDIMEISNIQLKGESYNIEHKIPTNTYSWISWEDQGFDHVFSLSDLKPAATSSSQILHIILDYGYSGSVMPSSFHFELKTGFREIHSCEISENVFPNCLEIDSYTTAYDELLTLRVHGSVEGYGAFYILDSSRIEIEPIPELEENETLVRNLVENEKYLTPVNDPLIFIFSDVFEINEDYLDVSVSLLFSITLNNLKYEINGKTPENPFFPNPLDKPSFSSLWLILIIPFLSVISISFKWLNKSGKKYLALFLHKFSMKVGSVNRDIGLEQETEKNKSKMIRKNVEAIACFHCDAVLVIDDTETLLCQNCGKSNL